MKGRENTEEKNIKQMVRYIAPYWIPAFAGMTKRTEKMKRVLGLAIVAIVILISSVPVDAIFLELPYYRNFEDDPVDTLLDDDECMGFDFGSGYANNGYSMVRDFSDEGITARAGNNYWKLGVFVDDCSTILNDAYKVYGGLEGTNPDPWGCNILYHYCPDVASLMVVNIVQNKELYPKQVLFDLNSDSLYNPLLKRGSNEFWPNGILANNGLFALVAVSLDSKAVPWQSQS